MRAITVIPHHAESTRMDEVEEPSPDDGSVLVRTLAIGVCGTDVEIVRGKYGWAPPGEERLILGHESISKVESAPPKSGFTTGDLVVGIVRRPDPVPCRYCAVGERDMCSNGRYTEGGIKERHGCGSELFRIEPEFAVPVDPSLGLLGVPNRAGERCRQGVGLRGAHWPAIPRMGTPHGPSDGRRSDRTARRADGRIARIRCACAGSRHLRPEAATRSGSWRQLPCRRTAEPICPRA